MNKNQNQSYLQPQYIDDDAYSQTTTSTQHIFNKRALTWASIIGNFNKNFIFISSHQQLYLIDQHAISEKELYLKMLEQNMIIGEAHQEQLQIDNIYGEVVEKEREELKCLGWQYEIKRKERNKFKIKLIKIPAIFGQKAKTSEFIQILQSFFLNQSESYSQMQKETLATISCHNSYRFGDILSSQEMRRLLENSQKFIGGFNCPHGRPIIVSLGKSTDFTASICRKKKYSLS